MMPWPMGRKARRRDGESGATFGIPPEGLAGEMVRGGKGKTKSVKGGAHQEQVIAAKRDNLLQRVFPGVRVRWPAGVSRETRCLYRVVGRGAAVSRDTASELRSLMGEQEHG